MTTTKTPAEVTKLQGIKSVWFGRKLSQAATVSGTMIPAQTGSTFDPSRDSDSTATKDGAVPTSSSLSTDAGVSFINNTSAIADAMYDSLFDGEKMEFWKISLDRRNAAGQYFAWYLRATVKEDSESDDPDDNATREVSFSVEGTPKRGWATLDTEAQAEVDYVFRGIAPVTDDDETGKGKTWTEADAGTNATDEEINANNSVAVSSVTLTPATATVGVGKTVDLTAAIMPANATDQTVVATSSAVANATVAVSGNKVTVTGVAATETDKPLTITVTVGGKTATTQLTVTAPAA